MLTESGGTGIFGEARAAGSAGVDGAVVLLHVVSLSATLLLSSPTPEPEPNPGGIAGPVSSDVDPCSTVMSPL